MRKRGQEQELTKYGHESRGNKTQSDITPPSRMVHPAPYTIQWGGGAAPVLEAMAGQGTRAAMAEWGAWAAMAERGARAAMAERGIREAMADRGAWVAMVDPGSLGGLHGG